MVSVSLVSATPAATAEAGELALPPLTATVQVVAVFAVAEKTSLSVVIVMALPLDNAVVAVNVKVSAEGAPPVVPLPTTALAHPTDVTAVIVSEFTLRDPTVNEEQVAVSTRLLVTTSDTWTFSKVAIPSEAKTVNTPPGVPVPPCFERVTDRIASSPEETRRPPES